MPLRLKSSGRNTDSSAEGNDEDRHQTVFKTPRDRTQQLEDAVIFVCKVCHLPFTRDYICINHINHVHWDPHLISEDLLTTVELKMMVQLNKLKKDKSCRIWWGIYDCSLCGTKSLNRLGLAEHLCITPEGNLSCVNARADGKTLVKREADELFLLDKKGRVCESCGEVFAYRLQYNVHMMKVHGRPSGRWHACEDCGATFPIPSHLQKHKARRHNSAGRALVVCDMCGKSFANKGSLDVHRKRVHTEGKRLQCPHCDKKFFQNHQLMTHIKVHFGASQYRCSACDKQFSTSSNLKTHLRIHSGERPYKCYFCHEAFAQKASLNVHMKKHPDQTGDPRYPAHPIFHDKRTRPKKSAEKLSGMSEDLIVRREREPCLQTLELAGHSRALVPVSAQRADARQEIHFQRVTESGPEFTDTSVPDMSVSLFQALSQNHTIQSLGERRHFS